MSHLFLVVDKATNSSRLINAGTKAQVKTHLTNSLQIEKASAEDITNLVAAGVKIEVVSPEYPPALPNLELPLQSIAKAPPALEEHI